MKVKQVVMAEQVLKVRLPRILIMIARTIKLSTVLIAKPLMHVLLAMQSTPRLTKVHYYSGKTRKQLAGLAMTVQSLPHMT
ncbi:hypothetical protein SDC9_134798 [bioreactor metagenome]|uniref:Uncharacterized protein n=1 Tax=bioreactor metagenome TaxID=1076179 RepID=A0A645DF91_9ZZZZ